MLENAGELLLIYLPWLVFAAMLAVFIKLFSWARRKKSGAIILAAFVHMFLPDPQIEKTIKVVQEVKQIKKAEQKDDVERSK
jgi:hypothetical protein